MCEVCQAPVMIYWLKNDVWKQVDPTGRQVLCPECAESRLGRRLTLHDLDIANYRTKGTMQSDPAFMRAYTSAVIVGGLRAASEPIPSGWPAPTDPPHINHAAIGEKLGHQTPDAKSVLPKLVFDLEQTFPL